MAWRDELTADQQRLLVWAGYEGDPLQEGTVDCYPWKRLVMDLSRIIDEAYDRIDDDDRLDRDQ